MIKKIQTVHSLIEIAENNLKTVKALLNQILEESGNRTSSPSIQLNTPRLSREEDLAREVVEGYFDGENMIGDNGRTYIVPQNYASKTQLVVGDRMKWILTTNREVFKLIQPVERQKVEGQFLIDNDTYYVAVEGIDHPIKILKASATFAMKTQSLKPGDIVSILIPKDTKSHWGAFISIVQGSNEYQEATKHREESKYSDLSIFRDVYTPSEILAEKSRTNSLPNLMISDYDMPDYIHKPVIEEKIVEFTPVKKVARVSASKTTTARAKSTRVAAKPVVKSVVKRAVKAKTTQADLDNGDYM